MRGEKTSQWIDEAENMLNYFKCPEFKIIKPISTQELDESSRKKQSENSKEAKFQAMMLIMIEHPEVFAGFSENTRRKYRNYYKANKEMNTEYAKAALKALKLKTDNIKEEIKQFLMLVE